MTDDTIKNLNPCPFCGSGVVTIEGKGQIWRGVKGYSAPQYYYLRHFCAKDTVDPFNTASVEMRGRTEEDLIARWNGGKA